MRRIAFVHPRGAGQFSHLASSLAAMDWDVTVLCETRDARLDGVRFLQLRPPPTKPGQSPLAFAASYAEGGYAVADALEDLSRSEPRFDLVVGHAGWGGLLFVKDVLPETPLLGYFEYFFRAEGGDVGFDPATPVTASDRRRLRARNMAQLATLDAVNAGLTPTRWQRSLYPSWSQSKIAVCHEGIDIDLCRPDRPGPFTLPDGRRIDAGDPVVTFVARSLEPCRGFPQFMRAAAGVAAKRKDAIFVVVGGDDISYGVSPKEGGTWRSNMLAETGIDENRVVFLGRVEHKTLVHLFQISAAHVYLTIPFVLSWSLLEAMACGCLVIGSATSPVEEVIEHGKNGILTDFWDSELLQDHMIEALDRPAHFTALRESARLAIRQRYALADCLDRQHALLKNLIK